MANEPFPSESDQFMHHFDKASLQEVLTGVAGVDSQRESQTPVFERGALERVLLADRSFAALLGVRDVVDGWFNGRSGVDPTCALDISIGFISCEGAGLHGETVASASSTMHRFASQP